jgi:tetratricopeptide (TPR) repeat protein
MSQTSRRQFLQTVALGTGALTVGIALDPSLTQARLARPSWAVLAPGVGEFIENTYLSHAADFPDANETVDMLRLYMYGNEVHWRGDHVGALSIFREAVRRYPNSRHAHAGYGCTMMHEYEHSGSAGDLKQAMQHIVRAAEIGMNHGKVRYTDMLAVGLGITKQTKLFERLFNRAFEIGDLPHVIHGDYARGLARMGDPRAEEQFQIAVRKQPQGHIDTMTDYAEWLLDQGRDSDVLAVIAANNDVFYPHFLRGVAAERQRKLDDAIAEYEIYKEFSHEFAAPAKYRIEGSSAQQDIHFADSPHAATHCAGHTRLSIMVYCEARGESTGAQRLCAWTARNRVYRGTISSCISISNSGATLCDKYYNVLGQSAQYYLGCGGRNATSDQVAYDIYYGTVPDGITGYCPSGTRSGDLCGTGRCSASSTTGYSRNGAFWFDLGCNTASSCKRNAGTLCGNDDVGNDHCYYYNPN